MPSAGVGMVYGGKSFLVTMSNGQKQLINLPNGSPASSLLSSLAKKSAASAGKAGVGDESVKDKLKSYTIVKKDQEHFLISQPADKSSSWLTIKSVVPPDKISTTNSVTESKGKQNYVAGTGALKRKNTSSTVSKPRKVKVAGKPKKPKVFMKDDSKPLLKAAPTSPTAVTLSETRMPESDKPLSVGSECPKLIKEESPEGRRRSSRERRLKRRYSPPPLGPIRKQRFSNLSPPKEAPKLTSCHSDTEDSSSEDESKVTDVAKSGPVPLTPSVASREDRMRLLKDLIREKEAVLEEIRKKRQMEKELRETDPDLMDL